MFNKNRIEALSDGIFAIAMTLLVLDIKVPAGVPPGHLAEALSRDAHSWISFFIAFGIACVFWSFQHALFDLLEKVDTSILAANFVFLCFVSIIPFTTSVWGHHIKEPLGMFIYMSNQVAIAATLTVAMEIARAHRHLKLGVKADLMRLRFYGVILTSLSAAIAVLVLPLDWIWPVPMIGALVGRQLRRRKARASKANAQHATLEFGPHDPNEIA